MNQYRTLFADPLNDILFTYSAHTGVSLDRVWLAVFQAFLYRLTQESQIFVATPIESMGTWGVALAKFTPTIRFSEFICTHPAVQAGNTPAQAVFQYHDGINIPLPENITPYLSLKLNPNPAWSFDPAYYSPEEIDSIPQAFDHFVENLFRNVDQPCSQVSLLSPEQQTQMEIWNHTEADFPSNATLHELISTQAQKTPERIAAVYNDGCLSYAELEQYANRLANALISEGVRPG